MLTLKGMLKGEDDISVFTLTEISNELWEIGDVEELETKTEKELFIAHLAVNIIGNWRSDGWWELISNYPEILKYIPMTLEAIQEDEIKEIFEQVMECFPKNTVFEYTDKYVDTVNFLQNERFKVQDEELNAIFQDERRKMVREIHKRVEALEEITNLHWGFGTRDNGMSCIIQFVEKHLL